MRPHHLRLRAFGPFPDEVEVDLDALAAGGLFLLHGETGAGKTTLLDAIGFALYGQVPGARGSKRLRSDHAGPDAHPEVTLELSVAGRRLRITRSPAYARPKRRGEGTVAVQPTVRVEELRGAGWTTWSARPGEADLAIADLIGMNAQQFFQVVLLPQGEFATFLRADATRRADLLERLFDTGRFGSVEDWLTERRRATAVAAEAARTRLSLLGERVAQVIGEQAPAEPDATWFDQALEELEANVTAGETVAVAAATTFDVTTALLAEGRELTDRQDRRRRALTRRDELALAAVAFDELAHERDAAALVAPERAVLLAAQDRLEAAARAEGDDDAARTAASAAAGDPQLHRVPAEALAAAAAAMRERLGRLDGLTELAARIADAAVEEAAAAAAAAAADGMLHTLVDKAAMLPALRAEALAAANTADAAERALPAAHAQADMLLSSLRDVQARDAASAELARLTGESTAADRRWLTAREQRVAVHEQVIAGQAAFLADQLRDGDPCAVCGSREHPAPADGAEAIPTEDAITAADAAVMAAEDARRAIAASVATVAQSLADVTDRLQRSALDGVGADEVSAAVGVAQTEVARLTVDAALLPTAKAALAALDAQAEANAVDTARLTTESLAAAARREAAQSRAASDRALLAAELGTDPNLRTARARTAGAADLLERSALAATAASLARAEAVTASALAADSLARLGARDIDAALRAARSAGWQADTAATLARHDKDSAANEALLADPMLNVSLEPVPDLPVLALQEAAARQDDHDARAALAIARERVTQCTALRADLLAAQADLVPLVAAADEARDLADLVTAAPGSANTRRMTLSSYVLAARLEEVALAASERLVAMTDGRFTLEHTDIGSDGRRKAGLGLLVRDAWTGAARDTATLSGGETFLASLALALGLADVVTAEAAGTPIDALFVDEGFGTLDEDTLDEVMDVLDGLRARGRVVGLVSHVPALRQRIPAQLLVHRGRAGSRLEMVGVTDNQLSA